ncbi:MAG: hypothetical protein GY913_01570 [Proteobacteria bacterium]|nr:hypothetical protein [Pseudomonadota bacterium]MCP4915588.1 hypothetical protein [Pseudomonadota bacterium]
MLTLLAFISAPAMAQDALASTDDEFDFLIEGDKNAELLAAESTPDADSFDLYDTEDDDDFADFTLRVEAPAERAPTVDRMPFGGVGRTALTGNYDAEVVHTDRDSVVVELPVLVAQSGADFSESFWLVGEVLVDGHKVAESRQLVTGSSVALSGPTVAFMKIQAPVTSQSGSIEVRVSKDEGELFTKTTSYSL